MMLNKKFVSLACAASLLAAPISSFADVGDIFGDGADLIKKDRVTSTTYGSVFGSDLVFDIGSKQQIRTIKYGDVFGTSVQQHTITVESATNGSVSVKGGLTKAAAGDKITLEVTADSGFEIESITATGTTVELTDGVYSFEMPATDVTVTATFKAISDSDLIFNKGDKTYIDTVTYDDIFGSIPAQQYSITVESATNGSVSVKGGLTKAAAGDKITLEVTADSGFEIESITATGTTVELTDGVYSFEMPATDVTVTATFKAIPATKYAITVNAATNGSISVKDGLTEAAEGETVTLTVAPADGYKIDEVKFNNTVITPIDGKYSFTMPNAPVTVTATFVGTKIALKAGENGTLKVDNENPSVGDKVTVTIEPETGYKLSKLTVNGTAVEVTDLKYSFNYEEPVEISAEFAKESYEIRKNTTSNGKYTISATSAEYGEIIRITTNPNTGYKVKNINVKGVISKRDIKVDDDNTFKMPAEIVEVSVTFVKKSSSGGGSSTSSGGGLGPVNPGMVNTSGGIDGTVVSVNDGSVSAISDGKTLNASKSGNKINITVTVSDDKDYVLVGEDDTVIAKTVYNADSKSISSVVKDNGNYKVKAVEGLVFSDVSTDDWFKKNVDFVTARGIMNGVGGSEFAPSSTVTRAMVVATLQRMEDKSYSNTVVPFTDVPADSWYASAVAWAYENGIVNGITETEFAPDAPVTREQLALILSNYVKYVASLSSDADLSAYVDNADVSDWALSGVKSVVGLGIITGDDKAQLNPKGNASRAEYSTMLKRTIENLCE